MSNRIVHFEIPCDDESRAQGFYKDVFGWNIQAVPGMDYTMVHTGPVDEQGMNKEPGFINGGMMKREGIWSSPVVVVDVDDIEASLEKVSAHGGSTEMGKQAVGDMGFVAYFKDCEGNLMGLWQNA